MFMTAIVPTRLKRHCVIEPKSIWILRVQDFYQSGLSVIEFCARHNLKVSTFHGWTRRLGNQSVKQNESSVAAPNAQSTTNVSGVGAESQNSSFFQPLQISNTTSSSILRASSSKPSLSSSHLPASNLRVAVGPFFLEIPETGNLSQVHDLLSLLLKLAPVG
jgi:hypothetical protein